MNIIDTVIKTIFIFEKEPQKVGLSQFKYDNETKKTEGPSIKQKDIKLSDLMRRAS